MKLLQEVFAELHIVRDPINGGVVNVRHGLDCRFHSRTVSAKMNETIATLLVGALCRSM